MEYKHWKVYRYTVLKRARCVNFLCAVRVINTDVQQVVPERSLQYIICVIVSLIDIYFAALRLRHLEENARLVIFFLRGLRSSFMYDFEKRERERERETKVVYVYNRIKLGKEKKLNT